MKRYEYLKMQHRCGNAVCPPLASAMVRANFPEWAARNVRLMAEFNALVGV